MAVPVNPGDVIDGSYIVERLLGQGGMGAVFVARDERLGRRVAIKVLLDAVAENPEAVARFEREARSAAALQSDHVTRVLSVGHRSPGGPPFIVMELLEGDDLAATLARRGPLPPSEVVGYMREVCEALEEAHGLGIVHRDLKPPNIFLSRRPTGGTRIKVLDFGISKAATGSAMEALTATTALMGTPLYMSPEQLREARNVDGRADLWALGVVMYELLCGVPPFVSHALTELCVLIMTAPHVPLRERRPDIPPAIDAVVNRLLQKNPEHRFKTARELGAALADALTSGAHVTVAHPRMATPRMSPPATPAAVVAVRARAEASTEAQAKAPPLGTYPAPLPPPGTPPPAGTPHELRITAGTVNPVYSTQGWAPPGRPNAFGLALAFVAALLIGGVTLYLVVVRPRATEPPVTPAASVDDPPRVASAYAPVMSASAEPVTPPIAKTVTTTPAVRAPVILAPLSPPSPPLTLPPPPVTPVKPVPVPSAKPPMTSPSSLMPGTRN
jgi:serine/threonine-protein kinase